MILCINLNAAIDKTVYVDDFRLNAIHRDQGVLMLPGGKGCNVARALKTLGEQPVVTGWVGGHAGCFIEEELEKEGIQVAFAHTHFESRTCLSILDSKQNTLTEIYERGQPIPPSSQEELLEVFNELLPRCEIVTLSGSLPPAVPVDFYATLIGKAHQAGVPTLLDSNGQALRLGLESGRPFLVKPNRNELQSLVQRDLESIPQYGQVAHELAERYQTIVVISLGADGLIGASGGLVLHARLPSIPVVSAVGSGDCTLAGLAVGIIRNKAFRDTLSLAVAAGAANTLSIGAGRLRMEDVDALLPQVEITDLGR